MQISVCGWKCKALRYEVNHVQWFRKNFGLLHDCYFYPNQLRSIEVKIVMMEQTNNDCS